MRFLPLMLSASIVALAGCEALLTAPVPTTTGQPTTPAEGTTPVATDPAKPTTTYMVVMNGLGRTLDEVNLKTGVVTRSIMATGLYPNQLLTRGATTFLVNSGDANLVKLDLRARRKLDTINLANGSNPMTLHLLENEQAMVVNYMSADVAFLDLGTKTVTKTLALPNGQPGGGAAITRGKAYVAAVKADYSKWPTIGFSFSGIHVIDLATRTVLKTITLDADANPDNVTVDPSGKVRVGVSTGLVTIDPETDTVSGSLAFGAKVGSVQYVDATKAYGSVDNGLVSFNPTSGAILRGTAQKIPVTGAGGFKVFRGGAYVTSFSTDTVVVVDLATEAASGSPIAVGDGPQDLTFITVED